jgi:phospholipase B1
MAGFAAAGITGSSIIDITSIYEYRGISYGGGGDSGAITIPNFFKRYNSNLRGASVGKHLAEICYGPLCFPLQCKLLILKMPAEN